MDDDEVDMDLLVDDQPDPDEDFADGHHKEDTEPQTQAEKNENELNSNGIAQEGYDVIRGTENFIHRMTGLSAEDLDELVQANADKADAIEEVQSAVVEGDEEDDPAVATADPVDETVGGPADVTVIDDDGEATSVTPNDTVAEEVENILDSVDTPAEAQAIECMRRIFSREDESDGADVNITVDNGEQNTNAEFSGDAVTISPADGDEGGDDDFGGDEDVGSDEGSGDEDEGSDEGSEDEGGSDEGGEGSDEGSEESWLSVLL
jgi:hypothetical protein